MTESIAYQGEQVLRYTAFSDSPSGGNPAGVVLEAEGLDDAEMQRLAAEVGYSETAFLLPISGPNDGGEQQATVRYFSPIAEVPFCGHATIATAVAHAERHGPGRLVLLTRSGPVRVSSRADGARILATLTSVPPRVDTVAGDDLTEALAALDWAPGDLDPRLPPRVAYAGASHLVLAARTRARLAELNYDFARLQALTTRCEWTTLQLVHRAGRTTFDSRNPFPAGGVYEDPATGAASAALGAYLSALGEIDPPAQLLVRQGADMGRPSTLLVAVPEDLADGVSVTGTAVRLPPG